MALRGDGFLSHDFVPLLAAVAASRSDSSSFFVRSLVNYGDDWKVIHGSSWSQLQFFRYLVELFDLRGRSLRQVQD